MNRFIGKVVRSKNESNFFIIMGISEKEICVGHIEYLYKDFNIKWEFENTEDQKLWDEYSSPILAKQALEDLNKMQEEQNKIVYGTYIPPYKRSYLTDLTNKMFSKGDKK